MMKTLSLILCLSLASCIQTHKVDDHLSIVTFDGIGTAPSGTMWLFDGKPAYAASDHSVLNGIGRDATAGAFYQATDQRADSVDVNSTGGAASANSKSAGGTGGSTSSNTTVNAIGGAGGNVRTDNQGRSYRPRSQNCE